MIDKLEHLNNYLKQITEQFKTRPKTDRKQIATILNISKANQTQIQNPTEPT